MKKFFSILTVLLMLVSSSVYAADVTADYLYDAGKNGFVVYGTSTDTKPGDEITVEAYLNGELFDAVIAETVSKDGASYFESEMILVGASKESGKIKFKVYSANNAFNAETSEFDYWGVDTLYPILKDIAAAMKDGDFSVLKSEISENYEALSVDYDKIKNLSGNTAGDYAKNIKFELPSDIDTVENIELVFEQLMLFRAEYDVIAMIGNFAELSSQSDFVEWVSDYSEILNLKEYNEDLYEYFEKNYSKSEYFQILNMESKKISDLAKLKDRLLEVSGLCTVKKGNAAAVKNVFDSFGDAIGVSYNLSDLQKTSVYQSLSGMEFASFDDLADKYDELAGTVLNPPKKNNNSSGGGGGGGSVTFSPSVSSEPSTPSVGTTEVFTDMNEAQWAKEAVYDLYGKKIVAGKTATLFMPNENITRAEFAKLLVLMSGSELDAAEQIFSDVNADDWYFSYVNKAYELGIVKGDDLGNFNPNAQITRQDMAAMVYRTVGNGEIKGDLSVFSDGADVSDYAKNAVSCLIADGIINGMGDGTFAPKANATRAQAAQVIYKIMHN